jgi:hypothetical protein
MSVFSPLQENRVHLMGQNYPDHLLKVKGLKQPVLLSSNEYEVSLS